MVRRFPASGDISIRARDLENRAYVDKIARLFRSFDHANEVIDYVMGTIIVSNERFFL